MKKGKLITISGIDGSGKSTLVENLKIKYSNKNINFLSAFSLTIFSNEYKALKNAVTQAPPTLNTHHLMNISWLCDLINSTITKVEPLLAEGNHVVLDRYHLCATVYSMATTNADISCLYRLYKTIPSPDCAIHLDIDVNTAYSRIAGRSKTKDYYETLNGLKRIQTTYESAISNIDYPLYRINSGISLEHTLSQAQLIIDPLIN